MTSRHRFRNALLLILALAAVAFAGVKVLNAAQDHETPAAARAG